MEKLLICSGDSFTDPHYRSISHPEIDTSWPKWPEVLAKKLDMRLINLGRSGYAFLADSESKSDQNNFNSTETLSGGFGPADGMTNLVSPNSPARRCDDPPRAGAGAGAGSGRHPGGHERLAHS